MDNFSAAQAHDLNFDARALLRIGEPFERLHGDDNLGDEAAFPVTWQHLAAGDAPHD